MIKYIRHWTGIICLQDDEIPMGWGDVSCYKTQHNNVHMLNKISSLLLDF